MSILVTGGIGYIGSHTVVEMIENGYEVVIVDNCSNSKKEVLNRINKITGVMPRFYEVDICNVNALEKVFSENEIEAVIHFAGLKAVGESVRIPLQYYENNIGGTITLLKVMEKYNVRSLIFSSSATVYGAQKVFPIKETAPLNEPTNPYGKTKLYIENILKDLYSSNQNWNITLLRYFNPIGAHKSGLIGEDPNGIPNNLLPYVAQVAIGKRPCLGVFGNDYHTKDGTGVRDYIHVCDLAHGHLCALKHMNGLSIYNLGTGIGYSVLEIVSAYEKANNVQIPYEIKPRREGDIDECFADASKAKQEIGFECARTLEDMCRDSYHFQSLNPNGIE